MVSGKERPEFLQVGDNLVEVRQVPERATQQLENCGIFRLAVEIPW